MFMFYLYFIKNKLKQTLHYRHYLQQSLTCAEHSFQFCSGIRIDQHQWMFTCLMCSTKSLAFIYDKENEHWLQDSEPLPGLQSFIKPSKVKSAAIFLTNLPSSNNLPFPAAPLSEFPELLVSIGNHCHGNHADGGKVSGSRAAGFGNRKYTRLGQEKYDCSVTNVWQVKTRIFVSPKSLSNTFRSWLV